MIEKDQAEFEIYHTQNTKNKNHITITRNCCQHKIDFRKKT